METWFAERPVRDLRVGDHAWLAFADAEEREKVIGGFVADGLLSEQEKVVYVTDQEPPDLPGMDLLPDPHRYVESGQLLVIPPGTACMSRGRLDPARMTGMFGEEVAAAQRQGFRAVRITTDFSWVLDEPGGPELMLGCESQFGAAVSPSTMAMAVCQIDRRRCRPEELIALRNTHEVLVEANPEFDDGVLRIVRTFQPHGLRVEGELDAARHIAFAEKLRLVSRIRRRVHLDFSRLRFIDLAGLNLLADHATLRSGEPLVLDNLPPDVEDVIEMVGWHRLPGLKRGRR